MKKKIKWNQLRILTLTICCITFLLLPKKIQAQESTIRGTVLYNPKMNDCLREVPCLDDIEQTREADWIPTPGAVNIAVKGTNRIAKTDHSGNYEILVSSPNDTLQFIYVSHNRIEVPVAGQNQIDIKLTPTPLPVIERLLSHIMPIVIEGGYPDIDELARATGVNRVTARDMVWLVLGNRRMSEHYPQEGYPDFDFEE